MYYFSSSFTKAKRGCSANDRQCALNGRGLCDAKAKSARRGCRWPRGAGRGSPLADTSSAPGRRERQAPTIGHTPIAYELLLVCIHLSTRASRLRCFPGPIPDSLFFHPRISVRGDACSGYGVGIRRCCRWHHAGGRARRVRAHLHLSRHTHWSHAACGGGAPCCGGSSGATHPSQRLRAPTAGSPWSGRARGPSSSRTTQCFTTRRR